MKIVGPKRNELYTFAKVKLIQAYWTKVNIFWEGHKICEISTIDLSYLVSVKFTVEILQNFVAFSGYMNFKANPCT